MLVGDTYLLVRIVKIKQPNVALNHIRESLWPNSCSPAVSNISSTLSGPQTAVCIACWQIARVMPKVSTSVSLLDFMMLCKCHSKVVISLHRFFFLVSDNSSLKTGLFTLNLGGLFPTLEGSWRTHKTLPLFQCNSLENETSCTHPLKGLSLQWGHTSVLWGTNTSRVSPLCKIPLSCFALEKQQRFLPTQWNHQVHVGGVWSLYELECRVNSHSNIILESFWQHLCDPPLNIHRWEATSSLSCPVWILALDFWDIQQC